MVSGTMVPVNHNERNTMTDTTENKNTRYELWLQDIFDSRDVIDLIAELEAETEGLEKNEAPMAYAYLKFLTELNEAGQDSAEDWQYGVAVIRDSYFTEYAQVLADDIGAIPDNVGWPLTCIDWQQAARELQMDYTPIEWVGLTFWVR